MHGNPQLCRHNTTERCASGGKHIAVCSESFRKMLTICGSGNGKCLCWKFPIYAHACEARSRAKVNSESYRIPGVAQFRRPKRCLVAINCRGSPMGNVVCRRTGPH